MDYIRRHWHLALRSARLDGTRLVMLCVISFILGTVIQRQSDVRQLSVCVDALSQARQVVEAHAMERHR